MDKLLEFSILAFTSLFTMVNPLGVIPVYTSLTTGMSNKQAGAIALKATSTALFVLLILHSVVIIFLTCSTFQ